jgi:hypothetical protein
LLGFLDPQIYFFHKIFSHPLKKHHKIKFLINYLITFLNLILVSIFKMQFVSFLNCLQFI